MISSEKVFDMLPAVVELYEKLDIDSYRKKLAKENVSRKLSPTDLGIEFFKYILKNSFKAKESFFEIVSIFEGKTVDEVKAQPFSTTILTMKEIFSDKEMSDFFKQAMQ